MPATTVDAMADAKPKKGLISHGVAAQNRKARFDYTIKETVEAGLTTLACAGSTLPGALR